MMFWICSMLNFLKSDFIKNFLSIYLVLFSFKLLKSLSAVKVVGPLLIGLGLPIEIAPLRSSTSDILNLASVAAYSSGIIDYKKRRKN